MVKLKGTFCKKGKIKIIQALKEGRDNRWENEDDISAEKSVPISHDHGYATCSTINSDTSETVSRGLEICSVTDSLEEEEWRTGRRIVELGVLADGLKAYQLCSHPLHLKDCIGERKFGLGHILLIRCCYEGCTLVNEVATGSKHKTIADGTAWDVNTKLAAGMIDVGLGEKHVNSLLSALNIPTISLRSIKCRERELVPHLSEMAEETCRKSLEEEVSMSGGNLTTSFDGAWQKRGTGRAYNSLTSHATLIGESTKKCIRYAVKSKRCRICTNARKKGVPPRKHTCSCNWTASAKSMEPSMACEMLQGIMDEGKRVNTLVMDNDSTTIARIKAIVDPNITKKSDSNHTRKGFTGKLVDMSTTYSVKKCQSSGTHRKMLHVLCKTEARKPHTATGRTPNHCSSSIWFYGGSESLETRVSASVCQKNDGYKYITELNKRCQMSPGRYTIKYTTKLAQSLKRKRLRQAERSKKRRRLELKSERLSKDATQSVLEGETYSSSVGLNGVADIQDINIAPEDISLDSNSLIFFDLETTGLARTSDILQIACVCGDAQCNVYTRPTCNISTGASVATGLTYTGGILKLNGDTVDSTTIADGLHKFLDFVLMFPTMQF